MDNDIIERAKEYADRHKETEINYFGVDKVYGYSRIYNAEMTAYERGAKEQKAIDDAKWLKIKSSWEKQAQINHDDELNYKQGYHDAIEKACKWIKENFEYYIDVEVSSYYTYEDKLVEDFRKAMEE